MEMQSIANDMGTPDAVKERSGELTHGCQTLFTALDHLQNYVRVKTIAAAPQRASSSKASASAQTSVGSDVDKVMVFLKDLPMEALARAAFACKAYARALRYTEEYLRDNREDRFQNSIGFLQVGHRVNCTWCVVCVVWCHLVCGVWCHVVCGVWCHLVCGLWCVVCSVWCVVCGVWCHLVYGVTWCVVLPGVWCVVSPGVWCVVSPGVRCVVSPGVWCGCCHRMCMLPWMNQTEWLD